MTNIIFDLREFEEWVGCCPGLEFLINSPIRATVYAENYLGGDETLVGSLSDD